MMGKQNKIKNMNYAKCRKKGFLALLLIEKMSEKEGFCWALLLIEKIKIDSEKRQDQEGFCRALLLIEKMSEKGFFAGP